MSEYQYYEFQAIDRPLSAKDQEELRAITSRAEITASSLINEYHYGSFKGNPDRLMDRYFDAFLYVANWGTHRLMLRLPAGLLDAAQAKAYSHSETLDVRSAQKHVVLDFQSNTEDFDDDFEGGEGWLGSLISLRIDLMAGDLRCLYLAWLAGVQHDQDDDSAEPPVPPGLRRLSASLKRFADFMRVGEDLIEVAAAASLGEPPAGPAEAEMTAWIKRLPSAEKDALLLRAMQGETALLTADLVQRFRHDLAAGQAKRGAPPASGRTVSELLAARDALAETHRQREEARQAKEKERREQEAKAARARHLDSLVGREDKLWKEVETAIASRSPKQYQHAVSILQDLWALAERSGTLDAVRTKLRALREKHAGKRTFVERLEKAGLSG